MPEPHESGELLRRVPLFAGLDASEIALLAAAVTEVRLGPGEYLFRQGDPGNRIYIVDSGLLEAVLDVDLSSERAVGSFGAGEVVGEMAILTGEPRSASVRSLGDSHLIALSKEHFERFVNARPAVAVHISRVLSRRLSETDSSLSRTTAPITLVLSEGGRAGSVLISALERIGAALGRAAFLVPIDGQRMPGIPFGRRRADPSWLSASAPAVDGGPVLVADPDFVQGMDPGSILAGVASLRHMHGHISLWMPVAALNRYAHLVKRADRVVVLREDGDSTSIGDIEMGIRQAGGRDVRLVFLGSAGWPGSRPDRSLLQPIRVPYGNSGRSLFNEAGVDRLARLLMKRTVGLALSGGAAQGVAHLGVIEALLAAGVPVDLIAGTSGGALYGALIAAGTPVQIAQEQVIRNTRHNLYDHIDMTLPRRGVIRGVKIEEMIRNLLGGITFADLVIPLCPVAADLDTGEEVVLDRGFVHEAVRASISVPGVFEPYRLNGRLLVDGGAVNPMPVSVARRMGADFVVGVKVPAPGKASQKTGQAVSRQLSQEHNLLSTFVRSYYFAGDTLATLSARQADVLIEPSVAHFGWRDYRSAPAIIAAGVEAGAGATEGILASLGLNR